MISLKKASANSPYFMYVQVYFDGDRQEFARFADAENGCTKRILMDSQGEIVLDVVGVVSEKVYGEVEIYYSR